MKYFIFGCAVWILIITKNIVMSVTGTYNFYVNTFNDDCIQGIHNLMFFFLRKCKCHLKNLIFHILMFNQISCRFLLIPIDFFYFYTVIYFIVIPGDYNIRLFARYFWKTNIHYLVFMKQLEICDISTDSIKSGCRNKVVLFAATRRWHTSWEMYYKSGISTVIKRIIKLNWRFIVKSSFTDICYVTVY